MKKEITYSSKNVYKNSLLSVVFKGVSMILSLISAPLILSCLGDEKYGIWASLLSIVSWIYYLDLGIGNGLRIRLSECLAKGEEKDARKYVSVSYVILTVISVVAFLVAFFLISFGNLGKYINVPVSFDENINWILIVAIAFVCLNFVLALVNNIFYAVQRASVISGLSIIGQILYIVGLYLYAKSGNGLILIVSFIQGGSQLIKNIIGTIWAYIKYPECRIELMKPDFSYKNGILSFGIQSFLINLAALVLNATDNLLILQLFGASSVTPYSFCYKYFSIISSVFAAVVIPLQSAYTMAYTKHDSAWIIKNMKRALILLSVFVGGAIIACFVFIPFSAIWLKKVLLYQEGLIPTTALYCILLMVSHTFSTFSSGIGRMKEATITGILQAVVNDLCGFLVNSEAVRRVCAVKPVPILP